MTTGDKQKVQDDVLNLLIKFSQVHFLYKRIALDVLAHMQDECERTNFDKKFSSTRDSHGSLQRHKSECDAGPCGQTKDDFVTAVRTKAAIIILQTENTFLERLTKKTLIWWYLLINTKKQL